MPELLLLAAAELGWYASGYGGVTPVKVSDYQLDKRFCPSRSFLENFGEEESFMSPGIRNKIFFPLARTLYSTISKGNCKFSP
jgi:hypothetical protein